MATKRNKRIDPNAAFAAIVGTQAPLGPEENTSTPHTDPPSTSVPGQPVQPGAAPAKAGQGSLPPDMPPAAAARSTPPALPTENNGAEAPKGKASTAGTPSQLGAAPAGQGETGVQAHQSAAGMGASPKIAQMPPVAQFAAGEALHAPAVKTGAPGRPRATEEPLVQKGYYITEEQHKKLGVMAVMNGADRSSIVRAALDAYFKNNS